MPIKEEHIMAEKEEKEYTKEELERIDREFEQALQELKKEREQEEFYERIKQAVKEGIEEGGKEALLDYNWLKNIFDF